MEQLNLEQLNLGTEKPKKKKLIIKPKLRCRVPRTDEEDAILTTYEEQMVNEFPIHPLTDHEYEEETRRLEEKYLKIIRGKQ